MKVQKKSYHSFEFIEKLKKRMYENNPARNPEIRKKMSKTWFKKGEHRSPETEFKKGQKIRLGKKHTEETKRKISNKLKGKLLGNRNPKWKGKKVKYGPLHSWIKRILGKPTICKICKSTEKIEWSNKNHKYTRKLQDWQSLCRSCHHKHDFKMNPRKRNKKGRFV